jgi:steroid 5-alpha reductase family enzyme
MNNTLQAYVAIIISTCICILVALASAQGGLISGSFPVIFLSLSATFFIQWLVFLPSYYWSTERFYDLTGSLTFILVATTAFYYKNQFLGNRLDVRSLVVTAFILLWALRLGSYLFLRILKDKEDRRFKEWKTSFPLFLRTWTLQGMWIFLTSVAGLTAICS